MYTDVVRLRALGNGRFVAAATPDKGPRMFGGQLLAQCLEAALTSVPPTRPANSLHAYFLRPGDVNDEVAVTVTTVRDGRSFSWREVTAEQAGKELFRVLISFQEPAESPLYVRPQMPTVPPPQDVPFTYDQFASLETGTEVHNNAFRAIDIRYVNPPTPGEAATETQLMWMRIVEALPDTPSLHQAGIAYLSDTTLIDPILLPHGLRWQDADFGGTSLDHAMWFHRAARADQWLLFVLDVETTGGGRGLASGRLFTQEGALVATCLQEGLMRWT